MISRLTYQVDYITLSPEMSVQTEHGKLCVTLSMNRTQLDEGRIKNTLRIRDLGYLLWFFFGGDRTKKKRMVTTNLV